MSSTRFIRAVLVTDGRSPQIGAVLAALADQTLSPSAFHIVVLGDTDLPPIPEALRAQVSRSAVRTYSDAVDTVLAEHPAQPDEFLWLLHDDAAPAPDVLAKLEATSRKRSRAAVVGAAHVRWDDASRLVNMGATVSRLGARRVGLVAEDDINQGQYDDREDVLAVSLAAALVAREAWEQLGGLDPGYDSFGDSLDFCRRAWTSGRDVVLVPTALIRHSQEALYDRRGGIGLKRATHTQRRAGEWYHALVWAPWWAMPLIALLVVPSTLWRAVVRIMQNYPSLVAAELLAPLLLASKTSNLIAARREIAATATHRGAERRLLATPRQVWRHIREREFGGWESARAERLPSDVVRKDLARHRAAERRFLLAVSLLGIGASAALGAGVLSRVLGGQMVSGPGIGATDASLAALWDRTWTGWSEAGLGAPALDGAYSGMWIPLALLGGDLRVGVALLLALGPILAVLGAWVAAGVMTRSPGMRAGISLVYGLWPLFLSSLLDARLSAVVVHLCLPWVAWGIARAAGWRKGITLPDGVEYNARRNPSANAGLLGALALACVTTAAPSLLLPAIVTIAVLGVAAGRLRWRVWTVGLLSLVIGSPGLFAAVTHPGEALSILWREPGPSAPFAPLSSWEILVGAADPARWSPLFTGYGWAAWVPGALLLAATLWAIILRPRARAVMGGLAVAAVGWAVAAVGQATVVAWPDGAGGEALLGWPGPGSSVAAIGLLAAVAAAYGLLPGPKEGRIRAGARIARIAAGVAVAAVAAPAVFLAWPGASRGAATVQTADVLPLAVPLEIEGASRQRALVVDQAGPGTVVFSVLSSDGTEFLTGRAFASRDGSPLVRDESLPGLAELEESVALLAAGGEADTSTLSAWGIGLVIATPDSDQLRAAFDANERLSLVGGSERGAVYRVGGASVTHTVQRAWLETTAGIQPAQSGWAHGRIAVSEGRGGVLIIAAPADESWQATLDGVPLAATPDEHGRQAFAVPSGGRVIEYEYRDGSHRLWWWAAAGATAWAILGAIPLGARGLRERSWS